jgi:putative transposase
MIRHYCQLYRKKNDINSQNYYPSREIDQEIGRFIEFFNNQHYYESLDNVTLADVYYGKNHEIITKSEILKQKTLKVRKRYNLTQLTIQAVS